MVAARETRLDRNTSFLVFLLSRAPGIAVASCRFWPAGEGSQFRRVYQFFLILPVLTPPSQPAGRPVAGCVVAFHARSAFVPTIVRKGGFPFLGKGGILR